MGMQLTKQFRSGVGGGGSVYPKLLQEDGFRILTEDGNNLAAEGPDNPTIVDLPCVLWVTAKSGTFNHTGAGETIAPLPNLAPDHSEQLVANDSSVPPYATYTPDTWFGARVTFADRFGHDDLDRRLVFAPELSFPAREPEAPDGQIIGVAYFAVVTLDYAYFADADVGMIHVERFTDPIIYPDHPDRLLFTVDDPVVGQAIEPDIPWDDRPSNTPIPSRALLEYRLVLDSGSGYFYQKLYLNSVLLESKQVTADPPITPVTVRTMNQFGYQFLGDVYEARCYSESLSDADYLSVRREMCVNYGLPFVAIL